MNETIKRLEYFFEKEKVYHDTELNLTSVSSLLNISRRKISKTIQKQYGKSFPEFINDYWLQEVLFQLKNKTYKKHTIVGLSLDAGFPSKSTFYRCFKKRMGVSPSEYLFKIHT